MSFKTATQGPLSVKAYIGDAKTMLAFNFASKTSVKNLAGFTIRCEPKGQPPYYLLNDLRFENPADHAQDASQPADASINAPFRKFRWLHVPGSFHQGTDPFMGPYTYTVTPRYFDSKGSMLPLDPSLSVSVTVNVGPFVKQGMELGFTRGFVQSQAFLNHFGKKALIRPKGKDLIYDTSVVSGTNAHGQQYTYADEYKWLGYTAREKVFAVLNDVLSDDSLTLDMFAYDLTEPDLITILLKLAKEGRIRVVLDNASLHHNPGGTKPEDQFETAFNKAAKGESAILRGKFGSFAHDKVLLVYKDKTPTRVLSGSTNFSVNGLYVNSNHVIVFNDPKVAVEYAKVFEEVWTDKATMSFEDSDLAKQPFSIKTAKTPQTEITFSPHAQDYADQLLDAIVERIQEEKSSGAYIGNVLFAVMQLIGDKNTVYNELKALHKNQDIYTYGITDTTDGIQLYSPRNKTGVLVTGKPGSPQLPAPFNQVASIGMDHQIHHKFIVCGINGPNPVVYLGSSNFANSGEHNNGDNLITVHDADIAECFAIEALGLVDHFDFLDKYAAKAKGAKATNVKKTPPTSKAQAAASAGWFLDTNDNWTTSYFDPNDLHCMDRKLWGQH
jgi:phosphatidylserine/phosphatidylglycerophosphate/cardiolipin synthase-like enzyme